MSEVNHTHTLQASHTTCVCVCGMAHTLQVGCSLRVPQSNAFLTSVFGQLHTACHSLADIRNLKERMQGGGIIQPPKLYTANCTEADSAVLRSLFRSLRAALFCVGVVGKPHICRCLVVLWICASRCGFSSFTLVIYFTSDPDSRCLWEPPPPHQLLSFRRRLLFISNSWTHWSFQNQQGSRLCPSTVAV